MRKILVVLLVLNSLLCGQMSSSAKYKLQSLILPGMGELKMGHEKIAQSFFIREAALWMVCIGGMKASSWYENDYRSFAALHAGINMDAKNYIFAVNMGHYDSFTEYNTTKARKRQVNEMYTEGQGNEWQWDSPENRIHFDKMRIQSVIYGKYASFAIGGLVLHRLISLIDVIFLERRYPDFDLTSQLLTNSGNLQLNLYIDL
tara:strand:+ start:491 stop:1099 length:609 start_codon:yes stop_codon:yes gene_type:complete